jgi:TIR domain
MGHDIFLSYASEDQSAADAVCEVLEWTGIGVWLAPRDILPGADWPASIIDAINGAKVMVFIFSGCSNVSPQVKREVERAVSKGISVLPARQ